MARRRGFESLGDMVRSLGLVLLAVAAVVLLTLRQAPETAAPTVDPAGTLAAVRSAGQLAVPAVPAVPGWRITSARYEPGPPAVLSVGYLTGTDEFVGFVITDGEVDDAVAVLAPEAERIGPADQAGFEEWRGPDRTAWVRTADDQTLVVVSTAGTAALRSLTEALLTAEPTGTPGAGPQSSPVPSASGSAAAPSASPSPST